MIYEWKIIYIWDVETVGQNAVQKRTFVLEELSEREYKGGIAIDLMKDKTSLIDKYKVWDVVKVSLNFRTNYSNNTQRYYNSVTTRRIEPVEWEYKSTVSVDDEMPF